MIFHLVFFPSLLLLSDGHTPTFRNEATHPVKAPTESTLGLQTNDQSAGRTKNNVRKLEAAVFSGGKHFEYMLLNDSSILLTSLQNDNPFEAASGQLAGTRRETNTSDLSPDTVTSSQATRITPYEFPPLPRKVPHTRIVGRTNFNVNAKKETDSYNSVATDFKVSKINPFLRQPHKVANSTGEGGANASQLFNFDYDVSFAKLLVSTNGIARPENGSEPSSMSNSLSSPKDIDRTMGSGIASLTCNSSSSDMESVPPPKTTNAGSNVVATSESGATQQDIVRNTSKTYSRTRNTNTFFTQYNELTYDRTTTTPVADSDELATSYAKPLTTFSDGEQVDDLLKNDDANPTKVDEPFAGSAAPPPGLHDIRKKKNGYNVGHDHASADFTSLLNAMVANLSRSFVRYYKSKLVKTNNITGKSSINSDQPDRTKVLFKKFTPINVTLVVGRRANPTNGLIDQPNILRLDADYSQRRRRKSSLSNWTNLDDGENMRVDRSVADLFVQPDDVYWFVLPTLQNVAADVPLNREHFVKYLNTDLAVRLYLEYNNVNVEAVFVLPPALRPNITVPVIGFTTRTDSYVEIANSVACSTVGHDSNGSNVTLLQLAGNRFRVLQLVAFKSQRSGNEKSAYVKSTTTTTTHDDVESYIVVISGSVCVFTLLGLIFYSLYQAIQRYLEGGSSRIPSLLRDKYRHFHEKLPACRSNSLNVIFSENFDRQFASDGSWLDNSYHSSSILHPSQEIPAAAIFPKPDANKRQSVANVAYAQLPNNVDDDASLNSPRLNKENKLNIGWCRSSCVLLPPFRTSSYLANYDDERYFDNPNYDQDTR